MTYVKEVDFRPLLKSFPYFLDNYPTPCYNTNMINRLQRQLIVHSYIYYLYNRNIWDDYRYDEASNKMVEIVKENTLDFQQSVFYNIFKDFDGGTGYHLIRSKDKEYHEHFCRLAEELLRR